MKKLISVLSLGAAILLFATVGRAATVDVIADNASPAPNDMFTITLHGSGFPGDGTNNGTTGSTLTIQYDSAVVTLLGAALAPGTPFDFITPPTVVDANSVRISVLRNAAGYAFDTFDAYTVSFQVNPGATPGSAANIVVFDDGLDNSWTDELGNAITPMTYNQANVSVAAPSTPNISVATTVAFGNVDINGNDTQTVTVTNSGTANLVIGNLASGDALAAPFSLPAANDTCSGATVLATQTCTFDVRFAPIAGDEGPNTDSFDIPSNDPDTASVTVNVTGTGGLPDIAVTDQDGVDANDHLVQFGDVQTNSPSDKTVTITNNGPGDLHIQAPTTPAAEYTFASNTCGAVLTDGASCVITVRFTPTAAGVVNSSFDIASDDADTPTVTVMLSGNGVVGATADISLSVTSPVDFGDVQVGQTSPATQVTVTNNGGVDLVIGQLAGLVAPFAVSNDTCSNNPGVAPAGTCTFDLTFAPTAAGAVTDTLDIPSNDPDTPTASLVLNGNGTAAPAPDITVSSTTVAFGDVLVGDTATPTTITVTNDGTADLMITAIATANPLPAPYGIASDTCSNGTLAATESCTFDVTYAPTAAGTINEAFDIPSNDADEASVIVTVSGTGTAGVVIPGLAGGSSLDVETLLGLGILGYAIKRRRRH